MPGMNCAIPCAPAGLTANGLNPRLGVELRGEQRRRDAPALRRAVDRRREARGHEVGQRRARRRRRRRRRAVAARRAGDERGFSDVAVVPRLPGVALHEVEAARVRGQPGVRRRRAEVELGRVAVQRLAGRRDPLRIGMAGEQDRLLGVGAEAAGDHQRDAVARARRPPCGRTPARRRGASACPGGGRAGRRSRRRARTRPARRRPAAPARPPRRARIRTASPRDLDAALHGDADAHRRDRRAVGERHRGAGRAVGARRRAPPPSRPSAR